MGAPIKINKNIHKSGSGRHCMHIEVDIEGSRIRYDAGDHVAAYPINNQELVTKIGTLLDINLDQVFTLINLDEDSSKKHPFPCPTTYRTALSYYVEITALYQSWVVDSCRHITHILEDMKTCKPPIDPIRELLPRLQPRFYSIASSAKVHPTSVHICGVVVEYDTNTGRTNKGVATTWLREKVPTEEGEDDVKVPVFVRRSQFRLPNRPGTPVIMIGPGTGLAPFRGFIQERAWQKSQGKPVGPTLLYFGCRNKSQDYIYQDELEAWQTDGLLTLFTAFSRDQEQKRYVTHC